MQKNRANELSKILNKKLIDECISLAKEIANNSFTAVKTSKMLINKGMDADIDTVTIHYPSFALLLQRSKKVRI
jgi:3-hydroxypropionyl-coenzyme A dehydratase